MLFHLLFGTLEFRVVDANTAYAASMAPVVTKKWAFYPIYIYKSIVDIKIGGVPPEIKSEWIILRTCTLWSQRVGPKSYCGEVSG